MSSNQPTQGERIHYLEKKLEDLDNLFKVNTDQMAMMYSRIADMSKEVRVSLSDIMATVKNLEEKKFEASGEQSKNQKDRDTEKEKQVKQFMADTGMLQKNDLTMKDGTKKGTEDEEDKVLQEGEEGKKNEEPNIYSVIDKKECVGRGSPKLATFSMDSSAETGLSVTDKMKIWQRKMEHNKISDIGDLSFPTAMQDFLRLHKKFPLPDDLERELSMLSFEKAAAKIVNAVAREHADASALELWECFERKLFTETQRRRQNATFIGLRWNDRTESVAKFAERVNVLGTCLEHGEDLLQAIFINGLPQRLQKFAYSTQGDFDKLVSAMAQIAETQKRLGNVRYVDEQEGQERRDPAIPFNQWNSAR